MASALTEGSHEPQRINMRNVSEIASQQAVEDSVDVSHFWILSSHAVSAFHERCPLHGKSHFTDSLIVSAGASSGVRRRSRYCYCRNGGGRVEAKQRDVSATNRSSRCKAFTSWNSS